MSVSTLFNQYGSMTSVKSRVSDLGFRISHLVIFAPLAAMPSAASAQDMKQISKYIVMKCEDIYGWKFQTREAVIE